MCTLGRPVLTQAKGDPRAAQASVLRYFEAVGDVRHGVGRRAPRAASETRMPALVLRARRARTLVEQDSPKRSRIPRRPSAPRSARPRRPL